MNVKSLLLLAALLLVPTTFACDKESGDGFVPKNDLYIPAEFSGLIGGITEDDFNDIIDRVEAIYEPVIRAKGETLNIVRQWENGQVNAYASRENGLWNVYAIGGLARYETVTPDGFALVMCHEVGHHLAGAPKKGGRWASNEGQSDYFATTKCLRKLWENEDNVAAIYGQFIPTAIKKQCEGSFSDVNEIAICQRSMMAGLSVSYLFKSLRGIEEELSYTKNDPAVVSQTFDAHPMPQCRLDTYRSGALCNKSAYTDFSDTNAKAGACNRSENYQTGVRPLCWYKPPQAQNYDKLILKNKCHETAYFLIHFKDLDGQWKTNGWYKVEPYQTAYVANTRNTYYYFYAQTYDGDRYWSGNKTFTFNGTSYYFHEKKITSEKWGTWTQSITCNN